VAASGQRRKRQGSGPEARKIEAKPEIWHALDALVRDADRSIHDVAEEAFRDLLRKHGRPCSLREALRQSARQHPANDSECPPVKRAK
jgi:hypothetical protein